ncbi:MAG: hypothetical protein EOP16_00850 [Pseudonocardia sp.]|nr:MAG: hypothetical protein EOP16_00850 [Pseudonocardia sp.]
MVVERVAAGQKRNDSAGYAEFTSRLRTDDTFKNWFSSLERDVEALMRGDRPGMRTVLIQRALIDLINFLDPDWIRFPDPNERGKLPLPHDLVDTKRRRPASEAARFRLESDPLKFVESWAQEHNLRLKSTTDKDVRTTLTQFGRRRHDLLVRRGSGATRSQPWVVEIHVGPRNFIIDCATTRRPTRPGTTELRPREKRALDERRPIPAAQDRLYAADGVLVAGAG